MSEDPTRNLTTEEKLNLILSELSDLRVWRTKVDAFIEDRGRDTRPMLELIHKELADTRLEFRERLDGLDTRLKHVESKLDILTLDVMDTRAAQREAERRMTDLERPRS